ncbi:hypothetical protein MPSEU_000271000 [Mayamaea pseudoterrestris]|nr:hypothetical protein MPSEU_000271000 [Mayamaea pseudoterrestris]
MTNFYILQPDKIMLTRDKTSILLWSSAAAIGSAAVLAYFNQRKQRRPIPSSLLKSPYAAQLKLAVKLALQAGNNMASHLEAAGTTDTFKLESLQINVKNGQAQDFCTQVDLTNERLCMDAIQKQFPNDCIIGEEASADKIPPLTMQPTWILDPVDGTTNFASGLPLCCVSIGYCFDTQPVMGVVYAPATREMYVAIKGYGAYRNGMRICSDNQKTKLLDAVVGFEFGYARSQSAIDLMVRAVRSVMTNGCRTLRCLGSGVLDICYVATGRLDVVYAGVANEGWKPWDYAAGYVIATEAGCTIEAIPSDTTFDLYSDSIICGTSKELVDELRLVITA